jgi:hypothetical protein
MTKSKPLTHTEKPKKKRVRYKVPTYKKADKIIQNIREYENNQKHIFRLKALHNIYIELAREAMRHQITIPLEDIRLYKVNLIFYFERERKDNLVTAEVAGTQNLSIKERLKIHIKALRDLRAGKKVKKYRAKKKVA